MVINVFKPQCKALQHNHHKDTNNHLFYFLHKNFLFLFYRIEVGIWLIRVEYLVAVHYCYQVFGVGEVDDVVCVTREHDDRLYLVATYFIVQHFVCAFLAELDESVTCHNDKLFPFGIVPMLTFSDTRLGDIDAYLTTVEGVNQFCERSTRVNIHFQVEDSLVLGQIAKECAIQTLGK